MNTLVSVALLSIVVVAGLGGNGDSDCEEDSVEETGDETDVDSIYLADHCFIDHSVEIIPGRKEGTIWLVVDHSYICVKNDVSEAGTIFWWECRYRRNQGCPYKITTKTQDEDECGAPIKDGSHSIVSMMDPDTHTCGQEPSDIRNEEFIILVKTKMKSSIKANYQETYDKIRIEFVNMISDPDSREKFLQTCPTAQSLRSAANRARTQMVPVAPKSFHDVDFTLMGYDYSEYILAQVIYFKSE